MKRTKEILKEIKSSLRGLDMFMVMLKFLVILMLCYLVLAALGIEPLLSVVPAIVYLISSFMVDSRMDQVKRIEMNYPKMKDMIITARDYRNENNPVLDMLEEDMVEGLKKVETSKFVSYRNIIVLVLLLVFGVAGSIYLVSQEIKIIDFDKYMDEARRRMELEENKSEEVDFSGTEESIMEVGNERVEVEINPVGLDLDFKDVTEEASYEFTTSFPKEVIISSGTSYEQEYTEEQQLLIKRYFENKKN